MDNRFFLKRFFDLGRWLRLAVGTPIVVFVIWRLWNVLLVQKAYGPETWARFAISGIILGGVYALIALGYTLVYGILFMINFAHGEVMMLGAYAGFFTLETFGVLELLDRSVTWSIVAVVSAFVVGMVVAMTVSVTLERIAYRPLRNTPRLVPLISAIGASYFLQNAAQILFSARRYGYPNPKILEHNTGWTPLVGGKEVLISYTGVLTIVLSILLMIGLYLLVYHTKMGKAMRAVAENKQVAALMGIDVDRVIAQTFAISGLLAGAAGVMWGLHMKQIRPFMGFLPGLKAFTAAVMGGIGNVPGAMLGGLALGVMEAVTPAALGIDFQLKDVLAFSILVLVLLFRPRGLLGEVLAGGKA